MNTYLTHGRLPRTGDDWQLYTASMKCGHAARGLTAALKRALKAPNANKAYDIWIAAAIKFAVYGARDTEPRHVALDVIEAHFGTKVSYL